MEKIDLERNMLEKAKPLLKELYGAFDIVPDQLDKPDAAIILKSNNRKIGIEITSVDRQKDQQYFNDEKVTQPIVSQQLSDLQKDGSYSSQPTKKLSIPFPRNYISDGVIKKKDKYSQYIQSSNYDEMIILSFSSYLKLDHVHFESYHKPWTEFLLSVDEFPFHKVIFACRKNDNAVVVYNKDLPQLIKPKINNDKELGITVTHGPIFPTGQTVNFRDVFNEEPLIKPILNKNKAKKERKQKRKAQRKARKLNSKK